MSTCSFLMYVNERGIKGMKKGDVSRRILFGIFEIMAILSFIVMTTASDDTPILYWLAVFGVFVTSLVIAILIANPYDFMIVIVPLLVCIGAFLYDKLHFRFSKTLRKCYRILKHEGSYKQCYETSAAVYDEYLEEVENNK